jgi:hypothetical protein
MITIPFKISFICHLCHFLYFPSFHLFYFFYLRSLLFPLFAICIISFIYHFYHFLYYPSSYCSKFHKAHDVGYHHTIRKFSGVEDHVQQNGHDLEINCFKYDQFGNAVLDIIWHSFKLDIIWMYCPLSKSTWLARLILIYSVQTLCRLNLQDLQNTSLCFTQS